jgi:hypothetical protein
MPERLEEMAIARGAEPLDELRWMGTHDGTERLDGLNHAGHAPERQPGGAEPHDFPVGRLLVPANQMYRVGGRVDVVERLIQAVEKTPGVISGGHSQKWGRA